MKKSEAKILLAYYIEEWKLIADGESFFSYSSLLQPVIYEGLPAMLKVPMEEDEKWGWLLMVWWNGEGAAKVLKYNKKALLLERISSQLPSLTEMVKAGRDDEASEIICAVAAQLHTPRAQAPQELIPLTEWFKDLWPAAMKYGDVISQCAALAEELLANQQDIRVLHGDLHHENILHSAKRGWLAIDPKHLIGERTFDFANIFCNPTQEVAVDERRLKRQLKVVAKAAQLPEKQLLKWVAAWAGLSASWTLDDGDDASLAIGVAEIALREWYK